ncbi:f-box-like domain-containing protein [Ditylenchus destructor]|uniref:F-box-like domain-containing protein n=1 Tax=Ditylenchus destructor TaxID=166010 RepID=A0AAD4MT62_9BILA|nr:f-box-like domain-containing protein [Ditylenchus destructor]
MASQLRSALDRISRISHELQQAGDMLLMAVNNNQLGQSMAAKLEIARRQCLDVLEENNCAETGQLDIQRPTTMDNLDDQLLLQIFSRLPTLANVVRYSKVCRQWRRVIESGIDSGQFYCCQVVSKETVGRAMGLLDLLQVLHRLRKHLQKLELQTLAVLNHDNPYLWEPFRALFSDMPRLQHLGVLFEVVDRKVFLALMRTFPNPQAIKSLHIRQQPISKLEGQLTAQYGFYEGQPGQFPYYTYYDDDSSMERDRRQYRELLLRKNASRELLNNFLRHFSFLEELHLCGFQDWQLLKVQYVAALEWPPNLRVLKIEDGIDVGFGPNHWRFSGNVFANLALRCSELRKMRIVVSPTDFVLMDLVKLFCSLESLDMMFELFHSTINPEPNCQISAGSEIIAPKLRFLRMSTEPKITRAILSVLASRAPRLTEIELFGSVNKKLLGALTNFPALECLTLSRLANDVRDEDLCSIFATHSRLEEFRLHFAPKITMEAIKFLLLHCKRLRRLDIFSVNNVLTAPLAPETIFGWIAESLKSREQDSVSFELRAGPKFTQKLTTSTLIPPGLRICTLELSKHRHVFLTYAYKKNIISDPREYLPLIKDKDDVYDYYPRAISDEDE